MLSDLAAFKKKINLLLSPALLSKQIEEKKAKLKAKLTPEVLLKFNAQNIPLTVKDIRAHIDFQKRLDRLKEEAAAQRISALQAKEDLKAILGLFKREIS